MRLETAIFGRFTDRDVDDDVLGVRHAHFVALLECRDNIDVPNCATVHQHHFFEVLRWENTWDRTRSCCGEVIVFPGDVVLSECFIITSTHVSRGHSHAALEAIREVSESLATKLDEVRIIEAALLAETASDEVLVRPHLPDLVARGVRPRIRQELGSILDVVRSVASYTRSVDGSS